MKKSILVIGSSNTDMVIKTAHLPKPGETILGGNFFMNAGGKGANQAVAAARLKGDVTFICKTGDDVFGRQAVEGFKKEGININYILTDAMQPSGVALITVDEKGENCIAVASGANAALLPADLQHATNKITNAGILLMQLETPLETIAHAAFEAHQANLQVILNPAPACELPQSLLKHVSLITPNITEAEMLSGITITNTEDAYKAADIIINKGVQTVIITMGSKGALICSNDTRTLVEAPAVTAVDTTAAGDIFNGALAVALAEGTAILDASIFACNAAALSVTRMGAQASAPYREEVDAFVNNTLRD